MDCENRISEETNLGIPGKRKLGRGLWPGDPVQGPWADVPWREGASMLSKPREEQSGAGSGHCELAGVQERVTASAMLSVGTELAPAPAWQSMKPAESTLGTPCGPQGGFLGLQNYVPSKTRKLLI